MRIGEHRMGVEVAAASAQTVAEELPLLPLETPDPPLTDSRGATELRAAHVVAAAGRAAVVLMAVGVPYVAVRSVTLAALVPIAVLVFVWLATLRSSRAAAQGMLGAVPTLGIGSVTGLVAVAALDPWFPGLQLGPLTL